MIARAMNVIWFTCHSTRIDVAVESMSIALLARINNRSGAGISSASRHASELMKSHSRALTGVTERRFPRRRISISGRRV